MNITVSNPSKSEITLTIELTEEQTEKYLNQAAAEVAKMVKIPGFRPGKAPREVLEKHVRPEALDSHMVDIALPPTYSEAILKEKIQAISRPKITILQLKPLKYEATVAVYPEVEVKGYDKIKVDIKDEPVKDEDVDQVLNEVKKQHATYKIVERPAKMGDRVEIDFQGFDEGGAHLEGTQSKNHPLILGDKSLIGGFEEELVGMKAEEKKKFKVTFPSDYFHKTFQDKKVEFEVQMNLVEEIEHPELNTEFFKKIVGEEKTLDQVKADIKENLETQKKQDNKVKRENEFLDKLADLTQLELPAILVEEEIHGMIDEFKHELENRGIDFQKYLEDAKKEMKDLEEDRRKEAEKRLRLRFGLQKVFEIEKIELTPEELQKEVDHLIHLYPPSEQDKIKKEYEEGSYMLRRLENKLRIEKLFERFLTK